MKNLFSLFLTILSLGLFAQEYENNNDFKQLKEELPTPNVYRTASGAPGHEYYQQQADYEMEMTLDDETQRIDGRADITYTNNSPDPLSYLWLQLDQNRRAPNSDTYKISQSSLSNPTSFSTINSLDNDFPGGFHIEGLKTKSGSELSYAINKTMLRVNLKESLEPGDEITFSVSWWYNINDRMEIGGRSGYEYFPEDDNYLYTIAQFYPRMAVYNDVEGWQNKQFLGRGEFALPFGNYDVKITVPSDHVVAATGVLQNDRQVLNSTQRERLNKARDADKPVIIITEEEAIKNEKEKESKKKTWHFKAENVRDFGWASSRKFIWDAMGVRLGSKTVMAMSFYPKEGKPLWERYSTAAVAHTVKTYSKYTFDYPYPVAQSIHAASIGMEYPMICFNFGRPEKDGTYSEYLKYRMISVIIHEVGHNYFPMIVNSDERQWTWMDEGLNTFLQYLTEQEWEEGYPSRRGPAYKIVDYMKGDKEEISPIMTNSESIFQFGNNAYGKPATALNILRETIMGRELFDYAFKKYAQRWKFKHPTPADFFRTMEDASAVDLDWFWRGWFYTTKHVDISIDEVNWYQISTLNPEVEKPLAEKLSKDEVFISDERNKKEIQKRLVDKYPELADFYTKLGEFEITEVDKAEYKQLKENLSDEESELLESELNLYEISFSNVGGLVMPIILKFEFMDGSTEKHYIPAEIWRMGDKTVSKVFKTKKEVRQIVLDPNLETADVNRNNNYWPARQTPTRLELFKQRQNNTSEKNLMQKTNELNED